MITHTVPKTAQNAIVLGFPKKHPANQASPTHRKANRA